MRTRTVKLGPLALLLTVIAICLLILSLLSFSTAQADLRLAEKYADTVSESYLLEREGQRALAAFPEGFAADEDGIYLKTITRGSASLTIEAREDGSVVTWKLERGWEEKTGIDGLWPGNE